MFCCFGFAVDVCGFCCCVVGFVVLLFCFFVCLFCRCVCVVFFPSELRSCVKNSEAAVPGSPSLIVRTVSVDVKQH